MESEASGDSDSDYEVLSPQFTMPPLSALTTGFQRLQGAPNTSSHPPEVPDEIEAASAPASDDSSPSTDSFEMVPPMPPVHMLTAGFGTHQTPGTACGLPVHSAPPPSSPLRTLSTCPSVLETFDDSKIILLVGDAGSGGTAQINRCRIADPRFPGVYIMKGQRANSPALTPRWKDYMNREIKFLKLVRGNPRFPQLIGKTSSAIIMTVAEGVDASLWMACRSLPCGDIDMLFKELKLSDRYEIAFHLAEAMVDLHRIGVTHCDLKPGNFMIKRCSSTGPSVSPFTSPYHSGWAVTVVDFGFAQHPSVGDAVKGGTTFYQSPDSVLGSCDSSVDVWAFGMVLGQLLGTEFTKSLNDEYGRWKRAQMQQEAENPAMAVRRSRMEKEEFAKLYFTARSKASERSMRTIAVAVRRLMMQCLKYDGSSRPTMMECSSTLRRCLEDELCFERLYYHSEVYMSRMPQLPQFDPTTVGTSPPIHPQVSYVPYPPLELLSRSAHVIQLIGGPKSGKSRKCMSLVSGSPNSDPQIAARIFVNEGGCRPVEILSSLLFQLYRSDSGRTDRSLLAAQLADCLPGHRARPVSPSELCEIVCKCLYGWALADTTPVSTTPVEDDRVVVSTDDRYLVVVDGLSDIEKHHRRSFSDAAAREIAKLNFNRIISALLMLPSCHTVIVSSSVDLGRNFFKAHQRICKLRSLSPRITSVTACEGSPMSEGDRRPVFVTVGIDFRQYSAKHRSISLKDHVYSGLMDVECSSNAIDSIVAGSGDLLYIADNCIRACHDRRAVLRELAWLTPGSPDALAALGPYTGLLDPVFDSVFRQWWSPEFESNDLRRRLRKMLVTALWMDDDRVASVVDGLRCVLPLESSLELHTMLDAIEAVLRHPQPLLWTEYRKKFVNTAQTRLYCKAALDWFKRYPFACSELPSNPDDVPVEFSAAVSGLLDVAFRTSSALNEPLALSKCFSVFSHEFRGLDGKLGPQTRQHIASIVCNPAIVPHLFSSEVNCLEQLRQDRAIEIGLVVDCVSPLDHFQRLFWKHHRRLVDWPWYYTQLCCQYSQASAPGQSDFARQVLSSAKHVPLVPHHPLTDSDVSVASFSAPAIRTGFAAVVRSQESPYVYGVGNTNVVVRWDTLNGSHETVATLDSGQPHVIDACGDDSVVVCSGSPLCITEVSTDLSKSVLRPPDVIVASHVATAKHPRTHNAMVAFVVESADGLCRGSLAMWNPRSGVITPLDVPFPMDGGFRQVSWLFDDGGSPVVVGVSPRLVLFWRVVDCVHVQLIGRVDIDTEFGSCLCVSRFALASRRHVFVGTTKGYVLTVTHERIRSEQVRHVHRNVPVVDVDGIGQHLACVCSDGSVVTWPSDSMSPITRFTTSCEPVGLRCYIEEREKVIAVLTKDADIHVLPFEAPQELKRAPLPYKLSGLSPDCCWLVSASGFDNRVFLSTSHDGNSWEIIGETRVGDQLDVIHSILPSNFACSFHVITVTRKLFRVEIQPVFGVCHIMSNLPSVDAHWIHTSDINVLALAGCRVDYLQLINLGTGLPSRVPYFTASARRATSLAVIPPLEASVTGIPMDSCVNANGDVLFGFRDATGAIQILKIGSGLTTIKPVYANLRATSFMHLRFSGNGDRLAVGTPQYVHLYKLGSADVVSRTKTISVATPLTLGPIHSVRFSHSGKQVAVIGGRQSQLQLYSSDDQGSEILGMFICPGLLDTSSCGENEWIVLSGLPTSEPVIRIRSL